MESLGASDPTAVGRYRILAELGRGGMGRVLLGSGPDGRLVAVKLVRAALVEEEGFRDRFRREVEASRRVSGAYTAAVVDADPDARVPWLAAVFVPRPSLHEAVTAAGALPEESALRLAAGLAAALLEIHRAGLVHRDLKPANVLLTDDGLRVIDFGIAKAVDDSGGHLTRTGSLIGSPGFMSPEQVETSTIGPASDVFSLGTVLAAAATGRNPFMGASTLQTLNNVVNVRPDLSAVPPRVRAIVERCLAKDPARRPTPEQVLDMAHPVPPSVRPWLPAVHRMIDDQRAAVARFLPAGPHEVPLPHATSVFAAGELTRLGDPTTATRRSRNWALTVAAVAAVLLGGAAVVWQKWPLPQTASGDTAPLRTYWNESRGDVVTCGTDACVRQQTGYVLIREEGHVYRSQRPGTVPLRLFWHSGRQDNAACVTDSCVRSQTEAGYEYVRNEGFVYPLP